MSQSHSHENPRDEVSKASLHSASAASPSPSTYHLSPHPDPANYYHRQQHDAPPSSHSAASPTSASDAAAQAPGSVVAPAHIATGLVPECTVLFSNMVKETTRATLKTECEKLGKVETIKFAHGVHPDHTTRALVCFASRSSVALAIARFNGRTPHWGGMPVHARQATPSMIELVVEENRRITGLQMAKAKQQQARPPPVEYSPLQPQALPPPPPPPPQSPASTWGGPAGPILYDPHMNMAPAMPWGSFPPFPQHDVVMPHDFHMQPHMPPPPPQSHSSFDRFAPPPSNSNSQTHSASSDSPTRPTAAASSSNSPTAFELAAQAAAKRSSDEAKRAQDEAASLRGKLRRVEDSLASTKDKLDAALDRADAYRNKAADARDAHKLLLSKYDEKREALARARVEVDREKRARAKLDKVGKLMREWRTLKDTGRLDAEDGEVDVLEEVCAILDLPPPSSSAPARSALPSPTPTSAPSSRPHASPDTEVDGDLERNDLDTPGPSKRPRVDVDADALPSPPPSQERKIAPLPARAAGGGSFSSITRLFSRFWGGDGESQ